MNKHEQLKNELGDRHDSLTERELEELLEKKSKEKTRAVLDRGLRFLGLVLATILFLVTFSAMSPLTVFAPIFGLKAKEVWLSPGLESVFESGSIYEAVIGTSPGAAIFIMTLVQLILFAGLALLISFYIRDVINVAKDIFGIGKGITKEFTDNVKEGLDETGVSKLGDTIRKPFKKKSKSLLDENDDPVVEEVSVLEEPKEKKKFSLPIPKKKEKNENLPTAREIEERIQAELEREAEEARAKNKIEEPEIIKEIKETSKKVEKIEIPVVEEKPLVKELVLEESTSEEDELNKLLQPEPRVDKTTTGPLSKDDKIKSIFDKTKKK